MIKFRVIRSPGVLTNKTLITPVIASLYQDAARTLLLTIPAATDTLVGKATTDILTNKTLTSPTIQGTVGAGTGLTMPAFTAGGDISLGANKLKTTTLYLNEDATTRFALRKTADATLVNLLLEQIMIGATSEYIWRYAAGVIGLPSAAMVDGSSINTQFADNAALLLKARDNSVGQVEIARLQGAADPYFQATLAFRLNPIATASLPAAPVEGMLVYDDTANKLKVYNGTAWETVTSA